MPQTKGTLESVVEVMGLINAGLPPAINLILSLKREDGTVVTLDRAEAKFQDNLAKANAWLEEHST